MSMAALYVGLSGLQTSSNSLNTTANNLSNVNTEGYVRQQVVNSDNAYNRVSTTSAVNTGNKGLGVSIAAVNHVRDMFLDIAYRKEYGRQGFYDKLYDTVYEIETQMGENDFITGIGFQQNITDFYQSINEIAKTPGDSTARAALVQSAVQFLDSSKTIYKGLVNYQKNLNAEVISTVDRINEIGETLVDLNYRIARIEAAGRETAADLRDTRDILLDELSSYCKITYHEEDNGSVEVFVEGTKFADSLTYTKMGYESYPGSELVKVIWPTLNNEQVYRLSETISTAKNSDIGSLKGLLVARGSVAANYYHTMKIEPEQVEEPVADDYITGEYPDGSENPEYKKAKCEYDDYLKKLNEYEQFAVSADISNLVNTMANFDKLVSTMVQEINNILCPEVEITAADGTKYTVLDMETAPITYDGQFGFELFSRNFCDRYEVKTIDGKEYYVRNNTNTFGNESLYTINNIQVNEKIIQDYSRLPVTAQDGTDDYERAQQLVLVFSKDVMRYNDSFEEMNFEEFYENLVNDLANTGKVYKSMSENETTLAQQIDSQRLQVSGVASDEELSNMIKYQQAYNASSRYINVVSEMLESLIRNLGIG